MIKKTNDDSIAFDQASNKIENLKNASLWDSFRERPFNRVPHLNTKPDFLFINACKADGLEVSPNQILEGENKIEPIKVFENLYLIPSDVDIKKHNSEKIVGGSKLRKIRQNETIKTFDIVFIDTPPTMSSLVQEALSTSDYYFIPSKPEFLAVEGVGQAMSFAKQTISEVPHTDPHFLGVVLNQVDTRRASYHDFVSELKQILSDKLFTTHIFRPK